MSDLYVYDVSEWQGVINWAAYPSPAVIVRLNYGASYPDKKAAINIAGARVRCRVRGWYTYLVAGQAPEPQADLLASILAGQGGLQAGEFVVCDDEEGGGDQAPRVHAYLDRLHTRFQESAGQDWVYSGQYFARAHLGNLSGVHRWLAAYGSAEMGDQHDLWQFTSSASVPGIAGKVDGSIYHGDIDQLAALVGGTDLTGDEHDTLNKIHDTGGALFSFLTSGSWTDPNTGQQFKLFAPPSSTAVDVPALSATLAPVLIAALTPHVSDPQTVAKDILAGLGKALNPA